jgi:hypothetical protein
MRRCQVREFLQSIQRRVTEFMVSGLEEGIKTLPGTLVTSQQHPLHAFLFNTDVCICILSVRSCFMLTFAFLMASHTYY